ncbi:hypothetical protein [Streptomyces sp. AC512_CC834]|uniref:hypothetical protein n=1 Tax=Streptomyces sp. AC512_CC834 TaxID=2823691 RepID=UPI001C255EED|nr:hypothetical protein [Streptomyces sp. AC512_CC834]
MTEPTSHVEQAVQARIAAAKVRVQAAAKRREDLAAARRRGLARRHAQKLRHQAENRNTPEPPGGVSVQAHAREAGTPEDGDLIP